MNSNGDNPIIVFEKSVACDTINFYDDNINITDNINNMNNVPSLSKEKSKSTKSILKSAKTRSNNYNEKSTMYIFYSHDVEVIDNNYEDVTESDITLDISESDDSDIIRYKSDNYGRLKPIMNNMYDINTIITGAENVCKIRCSIIKDHIINNHIDVWYKVKKGDLIRLIGLYNTEYFIVVDDKDSILNGKKLVRCIYNKEENTLNIGCINNMYIEKYNDMMIKKNNNVKLSKKDLKLIRRMKIKGYINYSNEKLDKVVLCGNTYYHFMDESSKLNVYISKKHVKSKRDVKLFLNTMKNVYVRTLDEECELNINISGRYMLKSDTYQYMRCNNSVFI